MIDSYASFNFSSKWSAALEGDYVINRVAANSSPARVYGGVGYLHRQLSKSLALNGRFEYLADRGGLFSGHTAGSERRHSDGSVSASGWIPDQARIPARL